MPSFNAAMFTPPFWDDRRAHIMLPYFTLTVSIMTVTVYSPPLHRITPPSLVQNISNLPNWQNFHNCLPVMDGCYLVINTLPSLARVTWAQCAQSASLPRSDRASHRSNTRQFLNLVTTINQFCRHQLAATSSQIKTQPKKDSWYWRKILWHNISLV